MKAWLGLSLLAMTVVQGGLASPPKAPIDLSYGPINYGLQMAVWFDPEGATAYCAIRNGTKLSVRYCDYVVGNFEFVGVRARRSPTEAWRRIPRRRHALEAYLSAGPAAWNIRWLRKGQLMPPGPYGDVSAYARRSALQHTFEVDLRGYDFPEDWTGGVECKIVQAMLDDAVNTESNGDRTLESPAFALTLPVRRPSSSEH